MSNDQTSFHVIDLKLDTEPSLTVHRIGLLHGSGCSTMRGTAQPAPAAGCSKHGARWSVLVNIYAHAGLTVRI